MFILYIILIKKEFYKIFILHLSIPPVILEQLAALYLHVTLSINKKIMSAISY